jgi:hypothetical protein
MCSTHAGGAADAAGHHVPGHRAFRRLQQDRLEGTRTRRQSARHAISSSRNGIRRYRRNFSRNCAPKR